ncbi:MAG: sulfatase-like hydrolase/transferase [Pseudomonadota bacterium]
MSFRNILLIGVDQMRSDVAGPGKTVPAQTPALDALYADSASFTRAYSTCPLCSPARASMFTGDYAFRHGMGTNCDMYHSLATELHDPSRLLHHVFREAGYRTGFIGKWHVGTKKGPGAFGFEGMDLAGYGSVTQTPEFQAYLASAGLKYSVRPTVFLNPDQQTMLAGDWLGSVASTPSYYLTERTIALLSDYAERDEPFFATVQYWDPHQPHLVAHEYRGVTDRSAIEAWPNFADDLMAKPRRVSRERDDFYRLHPRTEAELIAYIGHYCDHMAMLDAQIGRLLDWLDTSGLADGTLVVFTSDHGDMTGAHGGLIDKGLLYEEAIKIPLLLRHRSIASGPRSQLVSNMDILPTALDLLGMKCPDRHGVSVKPSLEQPESEGRQALLVEYHGLRFLYSQRAMIFEGGEKFIFTPGDDDELYDLNADPAELHNLADDPAAAETLQACRLAMIAETARLDDPLRDCVAKFNGQWRTGSGQFDATAAFDKESAHERGTRPGKPGED